MLKLATFFGGGQNDRTTKEYHETVLIGKFLADNNYIVKNGGYFGLMEAVSLGCIENSGTVFGYTCKTFRSTKGNDYLHDNIPSTDIYDRLRHLNQNSNIFVVQKGGIGTLSELILLMDEQRKSKVKLPIFVIGEDWKKFFENPTSIISDKDKSLLIFCDDYLDFVKNFNIFVG
jgi:uncharacterized protein (TIGR00725 family)